MAPPVRTDRDEFRAAARDAPPDARVPVVRTVEVADPFEAYRRARTGPGSAYLETTGGQPGWGYFGVDPVERLQVGPAAVARDGDADSPTLEALAGLLDGERLVRAGCEVPYPCGAIGWLSYDVARELETLPGSAVDDRGLPRLQVAVFDRLAAWREPRPDGSVELRLVACPRVGSDPAAAYEWGVARARDLAERIRAGSPEVGPPPADGGPAPFQSETGRADYADRVRRVKEYIREGDTFQANISHRLVAPAAVHPVAVYAALRRTNPAPYSALLEYPGVDLVSASPELLVRLEGERVLTEPIAGTRPRDDDRATDEALERDLRTDEKERAEHAMLVDLERNDLGKVSEYGSVAVSEYRRVDRYSEVMHLVSTVEGRLRPAVGLTDVVGAVFPGGTITGAPKPRTMEIIDEMEETRRGPYTGSVGIFGFDGRATLNIAIRTIVRHGEAYHLRVGAGVVHDSEPVAEYEETMDKARALVSAVDDALAGERAGEVPE